MAVHAPKTRSMSPILRRCVSMSPSTAALLRLRPIALSPCVLPNFTSLKVFPIKDDSGRMVISAIPISAECSEKYSPDIGSGFSIIPSAPAKSRDCP